MVDVFDRGRDGETGKRNGFKIHRAYALPDSTSGTCTTDQLKWRSFCAEYHTWRQAGFNAETIGIICGLLDQEAQEGVGDYRKESADR